MKKLISIVIIIIVMISLTACGVGKPEDKVSEFFIATQKFDDAGMDACVLPTEIAETTQAEDPNDEFNVFIDGFLGYMKTNASKLTFEVSSVDVKDDKTVVTVACRFIDGSDFYVAVMQDYVIKYTERTFLGQELSGEEKSRILSQIMNDQISKTTEKYEDITLKIDCIKKDNIWYIVEVTDEMKNILSSNFDAVIQKIENGEMDLDFDLEVKNPLDALGNVFEDILMAVLD